MLTNRKAYEYKIMLEVKKIQIGLSFDCEMSILLKKGKKKIPCGKTNITDQKTSEVVFNSTAEFTSIYIKDLATKKYLEEVNKAVVIIKTRGKQKAAGVFKFRPTELLNNGKIFVDSIWEKLERCPDKKAMVLYGAKLSRVRELDEQEFQEALKYDPNISVLSDFGFSMISTLNRTRRLKEPAEGAGGGVGMVLGGDVTRNVFRKKGNGVGVILSGNEELEETPRGKGVGLRRGGSRGELMGSRTPLRSVEARSGCFEDSENNGDFGGDSGVRGGEREQIGSDGERRVPEEVAFAQNLLFSQDQNLVEVDKGLEKMARRRTPGRRGAHKEEDSGAGGRSLIQKNQKKPNVKINLRGTNLMNLEASADTLQRRRGSSTLSTVRSAGRLENEAETSHSNSSTQRLQRLKNEALKNSQSLHRHKDTIPHKPRYINYPGIGQKPKNEKNAKTQKNDPKFEANTLKGTSKVQSAHLYHQQSNSSHRNQYYGSDEGPSPQRAIESNDTTRLNLDTTPRAGGRIDPREHLKNGLETSKSASRGRSSGGQVGFYNSSSTKDTQLRLQGSNHNTQEGSYHHQPQLNPYEESEPKKMKATPKKRKREPFSPEKSSKKSSPAPSMTISQEIVKKRSPTSGHKSTKSNAGKANQTNNSYLIAEMEEENEKNLTLIKNFEILVKKLKLENEELCDRMRGIQTEKEGFLKDVGGYKDQIGELKLEIKNLENGIKTVELAKKQLEEKLRSGLVARKELEIDAESLREALERVRVQKCKLEKSKHMEVGELSKVKEMLRDKEEMVESLTERLKETKKQILVLEGENKRLTNKLEIANIDLDTAQEDLKAAKIELKNEKEAKNDKIEEFENQAKKRNKELQGKLEASNEQIDELKKQIKQLEDEKDEMKREKMSTDFEKRDLNLTIKTLRQEMEDLRFGNEALMSGSDEVGLTSKRSIDSSILRTRDHQLSSLRRDDKLHRENEELRDRIQQLELSSIGRNGPDMTSGRLDELRTELKEKNGIISTLNAQIYELEKIVETCRSPEDKHRGVEMLNNTSISMVLSKENLSQNGDTSRMAFHDVEHLNKKIEVLEQELDIKTQKIQSLKMGLGAAKTAELEKEVLKWKELYKKEVAKTPKSSACDDEDELAHLTIQNDNLLKRLRQSQDFIEKLKNDKKILEQKANRFKFDAERGVKNMNEKKKIADVLRKDYDVLQKKYKELKMELHRLESDNIKHYASKTKEVSRQEYDLLQEALIKMKKNIGDALNKFQDLSLPDEVVNELTVTLLS